MSFPLELEPTALLAALIGAGIAFAVARLLAPWYVKHLDLRRRRARQRRAQEGERLAADLLRRAGYEILATQARSQGSWVVDGKPRGFEVCADFLVQRDGKLYVADAKTGRLAPRSSCVSTRRQLLEYQVVYDPDGVLLVDVEAGRIRKLDFPVKGSKEPDDAPGVSLIAAATITVAVIAAFERVPALVALRHRLGALLRELARRAL